MGQTVSIACRRAKYSAPDKLTPDVIKAAVADWALALDLLEKVPLDQVGTKGGKAAGKPQGARVCCARDAARVVGGCEVVLGRPSQNSA